MVRRIRQLAIGAGAIMLALCIAGRAQAQEPAAPVVPDVYLPEIELVEVVDDLAQPLQVTHAGDGSGRLFIVEKAGVIRIFAGGALRADPFLDITGIVNSTCNECGLLGIAFAPDYAESGVFYVSYNARGNPVAAEHANEPDPADGNDSVIARYRVSTNNPNRADPNSRDPILLVNQPDTNHNGGQITFGPDGMLYVTFGDGGGGGDPLNAGQRRDTMLGKVLRLRVTNSGDYTIPADNPFARTPGVKGEIWLWGLRNPWRWSFDRATGDLWLADVGQGSWEEVNYVTAAAVGGQNFGWKIREGSRCYQTDDCSSSELTPPLFEYGHDQGEPTGNSVTGGYVYRGPAQVLNGVYFFGDLSGWIGVLQKTAGGVRFRKMLSPGFTLGSFGEDEAGNVYVVNLGGGRVLRIEPAVNPPVRARLPMINLSE